jgi:hypothetical protein
MRAAPGRTWHSSHLGGHRFAATMACLPLGAWLGRVAPDEAAGVVEACRAGEPPLHHLRGMAGLPPVAQAAQVAAGGGHVAAVDGDVVRFSDGRELAMRFVPTGRTRPFSCGPEAKEEDPGRWEVAASPPG